MMIPKTDVEGVGEVHMVSATQLRTYGAGGFRLSEQEEARGCPRQYKAKYIEHRVAETFSYPLTYGRWIHEALALMEEEPIGPEEALERTFPATLEPEAFREALDDLRAYVEREAMPSDRFGTIATEQELRALLYVDEDFGPVWYRGFIDWLGIDLNVPGLLHSVDYKTNRNPPSKDDVRGDVQLKGYDWLIRENKAQFVGDRPVRVVQHLDAIKWREIEVGFTDEDIDDWHSWAVAVVRQILRDEKAEPELNPGCAWCPVSSDCPAFLGLPDLGRDLVVVGEDGKNPQPKVGRTDAEKLAWRDGANAVKLLLEKAVKVIDAEFKERAGALGRLEIGRVAFVQETEWKDEIDLLALHEAMGNDFYSVVTAGKGKIDEVTKDWPQARRAAVLAAIRRAPVGAKISRKKAEG